MPEKRRINLARVKKLPPAPVSPEAHERLAKGYLDTLKQELSAITSITITTDVEEALKQLKQLEQIAPAIEQLQQQIAAIPPTGSVAVKNLGDVTRLLEAIASKELDIPPPDFKPVVATLKDIRDQLDKAQVKSQAPRDYLPYRRVIKVGERYFFDDNPTGTTISGGGAATSTGGTVDTSLLSTSAKQDSQTTELQDIEADVESTNTRIGEVQANPTANTLLARSKDLLTELQLKADLTETQPVSAASLPLPSGAATATKQDTAQTALDAIKSAVEILDNTVSGNEMQVDIVTMPTVSVDFEGDTADLDSGGGTDSHAILGIGVAGAGGHVLITGDAANGLDVDITRSALPTGAATSANQTTLIGHLDGVEGSLTTLAGAVAGSEFQVDVLTMPTVAVTGTFWQATQPISHAALTELAAAINASSQMDVNIASGNIAGFSTSAKQDTAQTALDAIKTATEIIDNAISGSEMQVDVLTMPALTANPTVASTLVSFVTTVAAAGTRVQLASNSVKAGVLQAPSTNTGIVYVGGATVSSTVYGAELQPGQATGIEIDNTNKLYIDSSVNGDKLAVLGSA